MADVNANIGINIDTTQALAELKSLQRQISQFHTAIAKSSESAALAQRDLQRNFINSINSIGAFSAELRTVKTTAESFTDSLEKNKFSMREYFRYAGASTKTFGKLFKSEFDTIGKVAEDRVKKLQTQYIKMGRDTSGAMRAIAVIPNELDMRSFSTQTQIAAQKQALFNQLMKQGSTNLLNFGKNTQWAGRQLMVGFTIPLATLGTTAARTFMDMEAAALKFRKVYGDLFTPQEETQQALADVQALGQMFTKYGIAVSDTVGLAAEAAAAGFQGVDLQRQTTQATRLSVLGQIDNQKALETTISLQNAFKMSSEDLASSIDFLNAVENQTVVSLDDITTAIPKVAPVIQQLGGDVKDLTFFMAAMKEGGVNASEGANALKSGLAALINPTAKASEMLAGMGINITKIIESNKGNLKATVIEFAQALDTLDPLTRARAIEQLFGKFQFARLSTLFDNVINQTGQASRVLDLAGTSVEDLAALSESELGMTADSAMNKFRKSVEDMKMALVPVGETFLKAVTPIVEFIGNILEKFNGLSDGVKKAIVVMTVAIGAIGPVALMTFGLLANGLANIVKGAMVLRNGYLRLTGQTQILGEQTDYLTMEQVNAAAASHSLDQSHARLTQTFTAETTAINQLITAYQRAAGAATNFAQVNPGMMVPPRKYNKGVAIVPGTGNKDTVPAMLTPGESVIPKDRTQKYGALIQGIIADNVPGFMAGVVNVGGRQTGLDFAKGNTSQLAQKLIDEMLKEGSGIENALTIVNETLARMANDTKITIGDFLRELDTVTKAATGKLIPGKVLQAAGRKRSSSAGQISGIGTIEEQVAGNDVLVEEYKIANESTKEAQKAIIEYYKQQGIDLEGVSKESEKAREIVKQAGDVHRAHVIEIQDNIDKMIPEAWDPKAWVAQSSTLNQLSNILKQSPDTMNEYMRHLSEINADETVVNSIRDKITRGVALTGKELEVQKQVLIKMLEDVQTMNKVTSGFAPQAIGAIAATDYVSKNPATRVGVGSRTQQQIAEREFTVRSVRNRGQQSFVAVTEEARALTDQLVLETARAAGTQSPSKRTIPIGEDIARGLSVGMMNQADEVAAAAASVSQGATQAMRPSGLLGPKGEPLMVPVKQGVTVGEVAQSGALGGQTKQAIEDEIQARKTSQQRIDSFNKALMSGTFALTSFAGAGSFAGGAIGEVSQVIFKYSGLLFALMSVTQMLTQAKIAELVTTRLAAGKQAAAFASYGKGLLSKTGLLGSIARLGVGIRAFLGPIGLATTAIGLAVAGIKLYNKKQDDARQKIEGLGDAALLTEGKIKTLGDFFSVAPQQTRLERSAPALVVDTQTRSQLDALRQSEGFQKEFAKDIQALKGASASQANLIFKSLALQLRGKGFAKEQVRTIIQALQEESGKTDLKIDFASFDISTAKGQAALAQSANMLGKSFGKQFIAGYSAETKTGVNRATGEVVTWTEERVSNGLKKSVSTTSKVIAGMFNGLSGQIENGTITADQFNQSFDTISKTISDMPKPQSLFLLQNILKNMPGDLAKSAAGIKNVSDQLLIAKAAALGVSTITPAMIKALQTAATSTEGGAQRAAGRVRAQIRKDMAAIQELFDMVKRETDKAATGGTGGGGEKTPFQLAIEQLKKQRDELRNTTKAYIILKDAGFDAETALKYATDQVIALGLATGKIKPEQVKQVADLIKQIEPAARAAAVREFFTKLNSETQLKKDLSVIVPQLSAMGAKLEDITSLLQNPDIVSYLTDPLLTAEERAARIKKYIDGIAAQKEIDIKIKLQTPEGIDEEFADRKAMAMEYFDVLERGVQDKFEEPIKTAEKAVEDATDAVKLIQDEIDGLQTDVATKQREIEETINRPIEALQQTINDLQRKMELQFDRPIGALQDEASLLSEDLTVMDKAAEGINKKYDLQVSALEKVSQINQNIINQQKQQIGLAGALSSGDIAAAAAAAQEMRATAADAASQGTGAALQAAREAEIAGLRSPSGMTRDEIAQRQYEIDREIFSLQQQRKLVEAEILLNQDKIYKLEQARIPLLSDIQNKEDQIYKIQNGRLKTAQDFLDKKNAELELQKKSLQKELDTIDAQRERWEDAQLALDTAKVKSKEFQDKLSANEKTVKAMVDKWNEMQSKNLTVTISEIRNVIVNTIPGTTTTTNSTNTLSSSEDAANALTKLQSGQTLTDAEKALLGISNTGVQVCSPGFHWDDQKKMCVKDEPVVSASSNASPDLYSRLQNAKLKAAATGGFVPKYFANGGLSMGSDTVPSLLTPGEFVVNRMATKRFRPLLESINSSKYPSMIDKNISSPTYNISAPSNAMSMPVQNLNMPISDNSSTVYNYSVGITVSGTSATADNIAQTVLNEIKYIDSQRIRKQKA